jgi:hypothetical protein
MHNRNDSSPFSVQHVAYHAGNLLVDRWLWLHNSDKSLLSSLADINRTEEDSNVHPAPHIAIATIDNNLLLRKRVR